MTEPHTGRACVNAAVIVENRYLTHEQPAGMIAELKKMGHSVLVIDPENSILETGDYRWIQGIDIAVARGRSRGVFCALDCLERHGIPTINPSAAIAGVHDKARMTRALTAAHIPTPLTWMDLPQRIAERLTPGDFPVIVKPVFGDNCRGLKIVHSREQLLALDWPEPLAIIQKFISGNGFDLKLYCIGREIWAVRKPSPLAGIFWPSQVKRSPELLPLTANWRELAHKCGTVFGLELFGIDCIQTADGPLVIEINEFPNYSAVPNAGAALSNYMISISQQERAK